MQELYQKYLYRIQSTCNQLNDIQKKIIFLIEEKNAFRLNNKNDDADIVLQWFTDEIEKLKLLVQFDDQSTGSTNLNFKPKVVNNTVGDIRKSIDTILFYYRKSGHKSQALVNYYQQVDQPTRVKDIVSKELIPFENYFGAHHNKLNTPYTRWNGFYITPNKVDGLNTLLSDKRIVNGNSFVADINQIAEHIFAYRDGFIEGYNRFDYVEIEAPSSIFKSDELTVKKVIDYLSEHNINSVGNFTYHLPPIDRCADIFTKDKYLKPKVDKIPIAIETCHRSQDEGICSERILHNDQAALIEKGYKLCYSCNLFVMPEPKRWKISGFQAGKLYRAWFIVLSNFEIFDKHYKSNDTPISQTDKILPGNKTHELSVSDWSIVFYYLDEAGAKEGSKIDRIEKFIKKNNANSPSGTLTTKSNFRKEYYEIENRINGKNNKKPLPCERIENILSYLKNNKEALQAAKNDIDYLAGEAE